MTTTVERGELLYGLEYEGVVHYDVTMRLATIADNIAALEDVGAKSGISITVAMLARAIESIGTIPKRAITAELLIQGLADEEFDGLVELQARIKKKRMRSKHVSPDTGSSHSSLASTGSAKTTSPA
ncbi:hypothetical protein [Castellaniella caeni]|uniref:hypothetical protein n=1 Tax=Castellaniella caeni TaxID=266123 RepID=UPI000C9FE11E|nr:hypothetical protein [Castellaniella caeni]